ncbi:4Fe-4S dicluster domain-containing protein [Aliiroseovarius sp. N1Y82]|uniref:4Fe-4S dicluster domain-containing protein n=1 Tax=Aliiroseovarius subalbicans TaxID=2925840 RepID=UPI001F57B93D|nr:4Fe-4S dicluster domain-containing protein [Aliiroseovarius subalbicans]
MIDIKALDQLVQTLAKDRQVMGPVRRDGAVVYEEIQGVDDLPRGWIDEQEGGHYRLKREGDKLFGYTVGPSSWKRFLHPPKQTLWRAGGGGITPEPIAEDRFAFLGVRGCELAAIQVQDKVFMDGPYRDPHYAARRENLFIVAVNCTRAGATCFCASMDTGPKVNPGYDIALTEIDGGLLAEVGSDAGGAALAALTSRPATEADLAAAAQGIKDAEGQMGRKLNTDGLADILKDNPDHPRWSVVADACLNCANCTMVCPTCFCTTVDEVSALDSDEVSRENRWASCFTTEFSYVHGGAVRPGAKARYRQWMTHKLGTWWDQFDSSGCTGCGRCITWCPVGIDITEEAAAIRGEGG